MPKIKKYFYALISWGQFMVQLTVQNSEQVREGFISHFVLNCFGYKLCVNFKKIVC